MLVRCLSQVKQPASQWLRTIPFASATSTPAGANFVSPGQLSACSAPLREHSNWIRGDSAACGRKSSAQWPRPSPPSCSSLAEQPAQWTSQRRGLFSFPSNTDLSKQYDERRLVGYSPEQLFNVVADVEEYHNFVPWCARSVIVERHSDSRFDAELEVGFRVFVERYTSEVYLQHPIRVVSKVNDSTLFDHLDTTWEFQNGPTPHSCWLTFSTDFAFKSPLYGQLASVFFQEVTRQMMGAFEGRCRARFGASAFEQNQR